MGKLFGTDGVRGIPGDYPLTPEALERLALAVSRVINSASRRNGSPPLALLGRDTRASGPAICRSLARGFQKAGWRTADLGVAPTPAVSYLTPKLKAVCGVVVSASHNPVQFNGVKFFTGDGFKMPLSMEDKIERAMEMVSRRPISVVAHPQSDDVSAALWRYVDFLRSSFPPTLDLSGLKMVVDCAHGSASAIAAPLFKSLGAEVISLGAKPNGANINKGCGALHPELMQKAVRRFAADCGVCLDGDADRAIMADEKGNLLNGDALLGLAAMRLKSQGLLRHDKVVVTVMANGALLNFFELMGLANVSVPVGDRSVSEAMEREGLSLGGESSGHIIFRDLAVTGDGLLTALQTMAASRELGRSIGDCGRLYRAFPQLIENLEVKEKVPLEKLPKLRGVLKNCRTKLGKLGRIFIRYSGTEPMLRIMVEGPRLTKIRSIAKDLAKAYLREVPGGIT